LNIFEGVILCLGYR